MEYLLMIKLKTSCIIFVVSSPAPLRSSALISFAVCRFPSLETVNRNIQFVHGKFWDVFVLFIVFNLVHHSQHGHKCLQFFFRCPSHLFFHRSHLSIDLRRVFANVLTIPFLDASMSPASFLTSVIRLFSFLSGYSPFSCLLHLLLSLIPFSIFLLMSLTT